MFKRIAATLALALGLGMGLTVPAQAATVVGGLSVEAACDTQRGAITYAVLIGPNAYNWRCRLDLGGTSGYYSVDLNRECQRVYGGNTWATPLNSNDPYSWRCWR
ncbi:hypothetical protein [Amycolatopsis regifaucium]|uniref:Uncharacterized protein n=1 Tax=Amycolatopsis regifaucium TaxID=546365 RepID=A0A154MQS4_9PSEU|nr:hypothetical protein [Amycolatopsis regifaucium]KZB86273.1 hypothetical protein AVL48_29385 [Amycolatopsis regifaucium]OKA05165.1 hypothetical protein ATP06_0229480 [Amycolatopsis regifaucium]SFH84306.1 hypothetical protein SAMN04489731_106452 [Amycolatopsis regifaucium]